MGSETLFIPNCKLVCRKSLRHKTLILLPVAPRHRLRLAINYILMPRAISCLLHNITTSYISQHDRFFVIAQGIEKDYLLEV
jgi:hypothetical protein